MCSSPDAGPQLTARPARPAWTALAWTTPAHTVQRANHGLIRRRYSRDAPVITQGSHQRSAPGIRDHARLPRSVPVPEDACPIQRTGRQVMVALPEHID